MKIEDQLYSVLELYKRSPEGLRKALGAVYNKIPLKYRFGKHYPFFMDLLDETKKMNTSDIYNFQLNQINRQVEICKNYVPYYKDILADVKLPIPSIEYFKEQIPFTTKEQIRKDHKSFLNESLDQSEIIVKSTGGTTGEPLNFYIQKGVNRTKEFVHMNDQWARIGYKHNDLRMVFRSTLIDNKKTGDRYWFDPIKNRLFVSSFHLSEEDVQLYIHLLNKYKPKYLHVYPSVLTLICNTVLHKQIKVEHFPKGILCGSENTFPHQIELFKKVFKAEVFRWYGLGEEASLAGSCEYSYHYHPYISYSFTELVDEKGIDINQKGDAGEIVGTPFFNYAMPVLRYKTQDYAVYEEESCSQCGRPGPILKEIYGREQEHIYDQNGVKYSLGPFIFGIHEEFWSNFSGIQFIQKRKGELFVKSQSENLNAEQQVQFLRKLFFSKFNDNFEIKYLPDSEFEKTKSGKHKYLISTLN